MALKDLIFEYTGQLEIKEGTVLNNPEFRPIGGRFDLQSGKAYLTVEFNERDGIYKHGIEYEFPIPANGITNGDLSLVISANPILSLFTIKQ